GKDAEPAFRAARVAKHEHELLAQDLDRKSVLSQDPAQPSNHSGIAGNQAGSDPRVRPGEQGVRDDLAVHGPFASSDAVSLENRENLAVGLAVAAHLELESGGVHAGALPSSGSLGDPPPRGVLGLDDDLVGHPKVGCRTGADPGEGGLAMGGELGAGAFEL